jgi:hypothetical protein
MAGLCAPLSTLRRHPRDITLGCLGDHLEVPRIKSSARVAASVVDLRLVLVGERYSVPAHVFHQAVVPESVCTCTIVRMHSPAPGPVKVIGIDGYPEMISLQRVECSAAETLVSAQISHRQVLPVYHRRSARLGRERPSRSLTAPPSRANRFRFDRFGCDRGLF